MTTPTESELTTLIVNEKKAAIERLMNEGRTAFLKGDWETACQSFSNATEFAVDVYGQFGDEVFEPHFQYGRTLLEMARLTSQETGTDLTTIKSYIVEKCEKREAQFAENEEDDSNRSENTGDILDLEKVEVVAKVADAIVENAELDNLNAGQEVIETKESKKMETKHADVGTTDNFAEEKPRSDETAKEKSRVDECLTKTLDSKSVETNEATTEAFESPETFKATVETPESEVSTLKNESTATVTKKQESENQVKIKDGEMEVDKSAENDVVREEGEEGDEEEEGEGSEEEEEGTLIQTAWEVLEVARCICVKRDETTPDWQVREGKVLALLGSLSIVDENFHKAVEDLNSALEILQPHLGTTDRILSSIHVELADSHRLMSQYDKSMSHYESAYNILNSKLDTLIDQENDEDTPAIIREEIEELKVLVRDLSSAIEDAKTSMADVRVKVGADASNFSFKNDAENPIPANDLTNAIRKVKKRSAPTDESFKTDGTKKQKTSEVTAPAAGDAVTVATPSATVKKVNIPTEFA